MAPGGTRENTTIGVVATNARLTKAQAPAGRGDGARRIRAHHRAVAHDVRRRHDVRARHRRQVDGDVSRIGVLAAEAMSDAILRAVRAAKGLPGYPAVADIK